MSPLLSFYNNVIIVSLLIQLQLFFISNTVTRKLKGWNSFNRQRSVNRPAVTSVPVLKQINYDEILYLKRLRKSLLITCYLPCNLSNNEHNFSTNNCTRESLGRNYQKSVTLVISPIIKHTRSCFQHTYVISVKGCKGETDVYFLSLLIIFQKSKWRSFYL